MRKMKDKAFWAPQDETEYLRQELLRVMDQRKGAFKSGFATGALWGISHGLVKAAEIFGSSTELLPDFPPELVKAFAKAVVSGIPALSESLADDLEKAINK